MWQIDKLNTDYNIQQYYQNVKNSSLVKRQIANTIGSHFARDTLIDSIDVSYFIKCAVVFNRCFGKNQT